MQSFFFQAEDGIRDLVRSRGLGDVYKRQDLELLRKKFPELKVLIISTNKIKQDISRALGLGLSLIHI